MRSHEVESAASNRKGMLASAPDAMIVGQSFALTKGLNVIVQQSEEIIIADVLDAPGDLPDPLLQPILVHLHRRYYA